LLKLPKQFGPMPCAVVEIIDGLLLTKWQSHRHSLLNLLAGIAKLPNFKKILWPPHLDLNVANGYASINLSSAFDLVDTDFVLKGLKIVGLPDNALISV
jgi:hypothetical protein